LPIGQARDLIGPSATVFYELHVGTLSEQDTYGGVNKKSHDLGITAIELMSLNDVSLSET
jgi:1,4-alpha-glucan branching enzyme